MVLFLQTLIPTEQLKLSEGFSPLSLQPVNLIWFYCKVPHVALSWIHIALSSFRRGFACPFNWEGTVGMSPIDRGCSVAQCCRFWKTQMKANEIL